MPENSQQLSESSTQERKNFLDNVKNFFTIGGDKKKWRKAIIVSVIVVVFLGLADTAVWGAAIAAMINSIAEPNGNGYNGSYGVVKTMEINITTYSPVIDSNTCDGPVSMGGGASTADGSGSFIFQNGKIQWKKSDGSKTLSRIFAESQDYNIIARSDWDHQAVVIPGFEGGTPIEIHDTYGKGVHTGGATTHTGYQGKPDNDLFLDMSITCGEENQIASELKAIQKSQGVAQTDVATAQGGTTVQVSVIDYTLAGNNGGSLGLGSSSMDFRSVGPGNTNEQYGIWKNIKDVVAAVGIPGSNGKGIVSYTFMGHKISGGVNQAIVPALDKVQADLKASGVNYKIIDIQGFNWRANVNSPNTISPHAFGVAIDVNPNEPNGNGSRPAGCQHRDPTCGSTTNIPKAFSDAFEKNGFFWGAKFYNISDTMHFQYGGNYDTSGIDWNGGNIKIH